MWLIFGGFSVVVADEPLAPPQQVIQKTADQLQVSLQKPEYKADFKKATALVDQIINPHIDFDRVAILVLGKHWRTATPGQKERFKQEFRMLLVRTYTTAFTEYANWKIRYLPLEKEASDKKAMVKTEILQSGGQPVAVNYRMIHEGDDWKVYDVLIEGISLLQNYRTSFNDEVEQTGSLDQLIKHLAERNAGAMREPVNSKTGS
jgi:phospholipid transport system substrate-binding protein